MSRGAVAAGLLLGGALGSPTPIPAQARRPLPIAQDSTGVLSAIRAVDLRQLCRCPTVRLDTVIHRSSRLSIYDLVDQPRAAGLSPNDVARLGLARHRVVGAKLTSMLHPAKDSALMAIQLVPTPPPAVRYLVSVTPPNGVTAGFLVSLAPHRAVWRVQGIRSVFEP